MKAQKGNAVLASVLLLGMLGALLLQGLEHIFEMRIPGIATEIRRIRATAQAHSALAWGMRQSWQQQPVWQCLSAEGGGQACLRLTDKNVLLLGQDAQHLIRVWRRASLLNGMLIFSPKGWSDVCPLPLASSCVPP